MARAAKRLKARTSPGLIVAVVALVAALGGTAGALTGRNSVSTDDIKRNAVKTPKIAPAAVDAFKTDVMKVRTVSAQTGTTSTVPADLGGPNVTVKVPKGALVGVFAEADMARAGGGPDAAARVHLFEATSAPTAPRIMGTSNTVFDDRYTAPGPGNGDGASGQLRGGWLFYSAGSGRKTFSLRYSAAGGGAALFQNRKLYIAILN